MKAVVLLSGGLDSILAARILKSQSISLDAFNAVTPFCTCTPKGGCNQAVDASRRLGIPVKVVTLGDDYIDVVKRPRFGYGRGMNPCLDCRILLFKKAKKYMQEIGAGFIATGEVLGQRPKSQHLSALKLIEREAELEGFVLRPLSANLLETTEPEKRGWVDRHDLLAIGGRSRKEQIRIAADYGIDYYPCPAGGCRLCNRGFARKVKDAFDHGEDSIRDMNLLKVGRHFRLESGAKIVVGRNESENSIIASICRKEDYLLEADDFPGPLTLLKSGAGVGDLEMAASICLKYSDVRGRTGDVRYWGAGEEIRKLRVTRMPSDELPRYRVH